MDDTLDDETFWRAVEAHMVRWGVWIRAHTRDTGADTEVLAADVRVRLWRAQARGAFTATGAVVAYGDRAVRSIIIDALRTPRPHMLTLDHARVMATTERPDLEVQQAAWRATFWQTLTAHLHTPAERVAIAALADAISAGETARARPDLFPTVQDVYNAHRNVMGRIRRCKATLATLRALRTA